MIGAEPLDGRGQPTIPISAERGVRRIHKVDGVGLVGAEELRLRRGPQLRWQHMPHVFAPIAEGG